MGSNGISLNIDSNVRIMVYDNNHRIKQVVEKHNKATRNMILGLIRFLRGEFNDSNITSTDIKANVNSASAFIPAFVSFGDGGIKQIGMNTTSGVVSSIAEAVANPTTYATSFNSNLMQHELVGNIGNSTTSPLYNARCAISRTTFNDSTENALRLDITALLPKGYYSSNFYMDYASNRHYGAGESELPICLSELGLWASNYDGSDEGTATSRGNLLARVRFVSADETNETNVANVIKQKSDDVILVNWMINIASIDDIYSETYNTNIEVNIPDELGL